jgi:hypothetical protein
MCQETVATEISSSAVKSMGVVLWLSKVAALPNVKGAGMGISMSSS